MTVIIRLNAPSTIVSALIVIANFAEPVDRKSGKKPRDIVLPKAG